MGGRLTPPSNQDGPFGFEPDEISNFERSGATSGALLLPATGKKIALECYESSTNWINSGRRLAWSDSLRAFQSRHPSGSKYLARDYQYRSTLFRPKTRAMVRKAEAQTASAFFSNDDVVSVQAEDDDDPQQLASAAILQQLLQYRLTKTIPWFLTLVGARQDAEIMGVCVAKAYWKYEEELDHTEERPKLGEDGMPMVHSDGTPWTESVDMMRRVKDEPAVDLISPENFRFEPGADWRDPVGTSPYCIELIPMYIADVRAKMEPGPEGEPPEWFSVPESALRSATDLDDDTTRRSRELGRVPGKDHDAWKPREFDICWVRENIIRWGGKDWHYFTLGSAGELLTNPRPLSDVYLHGERPYVAGTVILEAHKTYASSKVEIVKDLQRAANDDWNLRFDNVKLVLNPRQFVRTGAGIELNDVRTFMPGKVIPVKNPQEDIVWDRPPDLTPSAYAEQDRINLDFDELVGDFSNTSVQASELAQQSATGMHLMSGQASGMNEYELRIFAESFVEPLIRLLIKIEQAYETDPVVLAIAGKNAQLFQKFGVREITDELLNHEVTTRVNVGIGATNPSLKLRNFVMGADVIGKIFGPSAAMGANFEEVAKEVFALLGYRDGARFFQPAFDPRVQMLQQQISQLQKGQSGSDPTRLQAAQLQAQAKLHDIQARSASEAAERQQDAQMRMAEIQAATQSKERQEQIRAASQATDAHMAMQRDQMAQQAENWRTVFKATQDAALARQDAPQGMGAVATNVPAANVQKEIAQPVQQPTQVAAPSNVPTSLAVSATLPTQESAQQLADLLLRSVGALGAEIEQAHSRMEQMAQQLEGAVKRMNAPRRIVRDRAGRATGVETIEDRAAQ